MSQMERPKSRIVQQGSSSEDENGEEDPWSATMLVQREYF